MGIVALLVGASGGGCAGWRQQANTAKSIDPAVSIGTSQLDAEETAELCLTAARQFEQGGRCAEAVAQYERVLQHRPAAPGVQHRLAVLYDRLEEHERASRSFHRALAEAPTDGRLWNDYGFYHYQRGRWQDAEQAYRKSCELTPKLERNRVNLGLALAQQGRVDEAFAEFRRVLSPAAAHSNLGMVLAQQGNMVAAQAAFEQALACEPGLPQPRAARQTIQAAWARNEGAPTSPPGHPAWPETETVLGENRATPVSYTVPLTSAP